MNGQKKEQRTVQQPERKRMVEICNQSKTPDLMNSHHAKSKSPAPKSSFPHHDTCHATPPHNPNVHKKTIKILKK